MAIDLKYGRVSVENVPGNPFGEDEPVIVFRARDKNILDLLDKYEMLCKEGGSPDEHLTAIRVVRANMERWQRENPDLVKTPD
jgi:hypothetical protein